jgi:hypothetical protein
LAAPRAGSFVVQGTGKHNRIAIASLAASRTASSSAMAAAHASLADSAVVVEHAVNSSVKATQPFISGAKPRVKPIQSQSVTPNLVQPAHEPAHEPAH